MSSQTSPTYIIGIGASAGGLEALDNFFHAMPVDSGMAFVVIQHLSPDFKSMMAEQLARYTSLPIMSVLEGDELICTDRPNDRVLSLPINGFFRSLANAAGDKAIAIVLSGTGSDGSAGVMDVYEGGGLVLVQSIDSARFDGMPRSAVATGCADLVLSPDAMPAALKVYAQNPNIKIVVSMSVGIIVSLSRLCQNSRS